MILYFFNSSLADAKTLAIFCISDGIIILVDCPSATFAIVSNDFNASTELSAFASFKSLIPAAVASCTLSIASASPSASLI